MPAIFSLNLTAKNNNSSGSEDAAKNMFAKQLRPLHEHEYTFVSPYPGGTEEYAEVHLIGETCR